MSLINNPRNEQPNTSPEKPNLPKDNPKYLDATPFFLQPRKFDPKPIENTMYKNKESIFNKRKSGLTESEFKKELGRVPQDKVKMDRKAREDVVHEVKHSGGFKGKDIEKSIREFHKKTSPAITELEKDRLEAAHKETLLKIVKDKKA